VDPTPRLAVYIERGTDERFYGGERPGCAVRGAPGLRPGRERPTLRDESNHRRSAEMATNETSDKDAALGLTSEKREDIWALLIAAGVLGVCIAAPDAVHNFFKNLIYVL
jgi:hypothetical protein